VGLAGVLCEVLPLAGELSPGDPLAVVGLKTDGDSVGGEEVPADVQAESATQVSTATRAQPMEVRLIRCAVRAMAVRALIGPPRALGNDHFPVASRRNRSGRKPQPAFAADGAGCRTRPAETPAP
jgi:hypothetical protein